MLKGHIDTTLVYATALLQGRYAEVKMTQAERSPKALGTRVKTGEIQFHHEVTNQYLWNQF